MNENLNKLQQIFIQSQRQIKQEIKEDIKQPTESLLQYTLPQEASSSLIKKKQSIPVPQLEAKPQMDELLNSLIKPRDWEQDSKTFMQTVSSLPPSRDDITNLQKLLDERLVARQARESGLCPIREELFNQCFDEIIRQVTIDSMDRGVILARVRDDLQKTIQSYRTLYEGSIPFSLQKQLNAEVGISQLEDQIAQLNEKKNELELKVFYSPNKKQLLINKREAIEKQNVDRKQQNEARRKAEIEFLKYQSSHLESYLKQVNPNKA